MTKSILQSTLIATICAALSPLLSAQQTGSIVGTVEDQSGAVIVKAKVTLVNTQTKGIRSTTSNADGFFAFSGTEAGNYTVKVESQGFRRAEETGIHVGPGDRRNLNVTLAIGSTDASVTVTATESTIIVDSGNQPGLQLLIGMSGRSRAAAFRQTFCASAVIAAEVYLPYKRC